MRVIFKTKSEVAERVVFLIAIIVICLDVLYWRK
jgi:hypothetical protein